MRQILLPILLLLGLSSLQAQSDSSAATKTVQISFANPIKEARAELKTAFLSNDPAWAGMWIDSLKRLETPTQAALIWDETWLLYFWEESYGNLFEEVANFNAYKFDEQASKTQPEEDGLFQVLDSALLEERYDIFNNIQNAFLNEEEKAFSSVLMDYLLRTQGSNAEWHDILENYLRRYPNSRFRNFIEYIKPALAKSDIRKAWSFNLGFATGTWTSELERTIREPHGIDIGISYHQKRWNYGLLATVTGQKLNRPLYDNYDFEWAVGVKSTYLAVDLEVGYDIFNGKKLRVYPCAGLGFNSLNPPSSEDDGSDEYIDPYANFIYNSFHLETSINADLKMFISNGMDASELSAKSYQGARLRLGYRRMYLGADDPLLAGNMFFFSVGYQLLSYKKK